MGRKQRDTVEYFSHDAHSASGGDDSITILQGAYGNNGYAVYYKIKEKLAHTDGHFIDCRNPKKWKLFVNYLGVDEITTVEIINLLVEIGEIDEELWISKIIWCNNFVEDLVDVYKNRRRELPQKPIITKENHISTIETPISTVETPISTTKSTQSKESKESKGSRGSKVEESSENDLDPEEDDLPPWLLLLTTTFNNFQPKDAWIEMIKKDWKDINLDEMAQEFVSYWGEKTNDQSVIQAQFVNSLHHARENGKFKSKEKDYFKGRYGHLVQR